MRCEIFWLKHLKPTHRLHPSFLSEEHKRTDDKQNSPINIYCSYMCYIETRVRVNMLNAIKIERLQIKVAVLLKSVSVNVFRLI